MVKVLDWRAMMMFSRVRVGEAEGDMTRPDLSRMGSVRRKLQIRGATSFSLTVVAVESPSG